VRVGSDAVFVSEKYGTVEELRLGLDNVAKLIVVEL